MVLVTLMLLPGITNAYPDGIGAGGHSHNGETIDDVAKEGCLCHGEQPSNDVMVLLVDVPYTWVAGAAYEMRLEVIGGPDTNMGGLSARVSSGEWSGDAPGPRRALLVIIADPRPQFRSGARGRAPRFPLIFLLVLRLVSTEHNIGPQHLGQRHVRVRRRDMIAARHEARAVASNKIALRDAAPIPAPAGRPGVAAAAGVREVASFKRLPGDVAERPLVRRAPVVQQQRVGVIW